MPTHSARAALLLASLLASTMAMATTVGSGHVASEKRKVADFQEIEVSDGVRLEVKQGATSLTIEGDDNLLPLYVTEVVGGRLSIHKKNRESVQHDQPLIVRVTTPALKRLSAHGGVEALIDGVSGPRFEAALSGGVELEAKGLAVDDLVVSSSGGVEASFSGAAKKARFDLSGGVDVEAKALQIAQLDIDASGGCSVDVAVKDAMAGDISGGVDMTVHGHPTSRVRTSGGADIDYVD